MVNVVLDSDFLSAFLKIEALHRVREYGLVLRWRPRGPRRERARIPHVPVATRPGGRSRVSPRPSRRS